MSKFIIVVHVVFTLKRSKDTTLNLSCAAHVQHMPTITDKVDSDNDTLSTKVIFMKIYRITTDSQDCKVSALC